MAYQVKTTTSFGQRIISSFKSIGFGFLIFIAGTVALFWNEGSFVKTKKSLREAESVMVSMNDISVVDASFDGKLVHAVGRADTDETLTDAEFGVSETAIAISRAVEYYQWVEKSTTQTRDKVGGGQEKVTTYTYEAKWMSKPVNSANFNDPDYKSRNTVLVTVDSQKDYARNVSFGGYRLPRFFVTRIGGSTKATVNMSEEQQEQWRQRISAANPEASLHVRDNNVYFGKSTSAPEIGDVRITFTKTPPATISIIAQVAGSTFEEFTAKNGKTIAMLHPGTVNAKKMFENAHSTNKTMTWILRILGFILVIFGLRLVFNFLPTLFKFLPFLSKIVNAGIKLVTIVFGGAWSLAIIAVAWLFYRPLIGVPLLLLSIAGIWFLRKKAKEKEQPTV